MYCFTRVISSLVLVAAVLEGCSPKAPSAGHVIILGFDAMSAAGIQRAHTPNFNRMIENGAVSVHTRCIRETSSSQNWMTMVSAAPIEMHGVLTNAWKPGMSENVPPALENNIGLFPTIFDDIRAQKPDLRQYAFIEWTSETRMYDMAAFDSTWVQKTDPEIRNYRDVLDKAFTKYLEDRPEMMFVSIDITDHMGHTFGHESEEYLNTISQMDSLAGSFVRQLDERGWMDDTVIIVTADHGGLNLGHGGDTMAEYEIPIILYGKGVTKGKVMKRTNMIYDVGATAAGLLGVELPWECRGKLLIEAFEPADPAVFVPAPFVRPFSGRAEEVTMTVDDPEAEIRYTLDGSAPDANSTLYEGPFKLEKGCRIRSAAFKNGSKSAEAENFLDPSGFDAPVYYKLYRNVEGNDMPDFTKFGNPSETGYIDKFSLDELGVSTEDHFAVLFTSKLVVDKEADYRFQLKSDDGANLYIDGQTVVANPSAHNIIPKYGTIHLTPGKHVMKIEFLEISSVQSLTVNMSIDGEDLRPIMAHELDR